METARDGVLEPVIVHPRESDSKSCNDDDTELMLRCLYCAETVYNYVLSINQLYNNLCHGTTNALFPIRATMAVL
jgi:hypothetical protein